MKRKVLYTVLFSAVLSLATMNIGFAATGGSVGFGNISVYKNGKLETKLKGQNPIEDRALLVCDGKCMVKSEGISLIGNDKSQLAVSNEADTFKLYVKEGHVDYVINSNARKIAFYTPKGTYTVADVVFNASSQTAVKGAVDVASDGSTEISVTEGRLVFATSEGMKTVDANNKIVLAVAPAGAGDGAGEGLFGLSTPVLVGGGLVVAGGAAVAIHNSSSSSSRPQTASPNQ